MCYVIFFFAILILMYSTFAVTAWVVDDGDDEQEK